MPEPEDPSEALARYAEALADGIEAVLDKWVVRCVVDLVTAWRGYVHSEIRAAAAEAGERCRAEVGSQVRTLLLADIDAQRGTPLSVLRRAVSYPTAVLVDAGVPPVVRDSFAERVFPDDVYGLAPASYADVDPSLGDLGIAWGAAKAFEHRRRHRHPGA